MQSSSVLEPFTRQDRMPTRKKFSYRSSDVSSGVPCSPDCAKGIVASTWDDNVNSPRHIVRGESTDVEGRRGWRLAPRRKFY